MTKLTTALEERRKQWDVQEQRLRENILQQRRQRVQDATERFQRAHLPPSQRRRPFFRKDVPSIDDALNQIQGTMSSYSQQSSFLSSNSNISRSCTPSSKPPMASKPSYYRAAVDVYAKVLQESRVGFRNSPQLFASEPEESQEREEEAFSPQERHASHLCNSESLSSQDSLENEEPAHSTVNLQRSYSSSLLDVKKPPSLQKSQNYLCTSSDLNSFSAMTFLDDDLHQPRKMPETTHDKQEEPYELNKGEHKPYNASWCFTSTAQTAKSESPPAPNCSLLTLCEVIDAEPKHYEGDSPRSNPSDNIKVVANNEVSGHTALESAFLKQEAQLHLRQQSIHDDRQLKHLSTTEILLPAKNGNKEDVFVARPKANIFLKDNTTDNGSQEEALQQTGKENHHLSSQKESSASINNLNKVSNSEPKIEKPMKAVTLQQACLSNIQSDAPKCLECSEEEVQKLPVSVGMSHSDSKICEVKFIKGILKKPSKYISGDALSLYGSGHLIFAKQVGLTIRDSVELTRAKSKDVDANRTIKKKLRWFDEVQLEKEDKEQNMNMRKQTKSKSSNPSQSNSNTEDHQPCLTAVSGAYKLRPSMTPPASAGYHFTKQAWADVGVQVSMPKERGDEVKVPRSSTRTGGPKVPRRVRSARAGAVPVSSRARKGTVIRPQSATEVSQIAKTQGKIMAPRPPPPRTEIMDEKSGEKTAHVTKTPQNADHVSVSCKQAPPTEKTSHKNNAEGFFTPHTHNAIRTDRSITYMPAPPLYTCSVLEGNTEGPPGSGHQEAQGCGGRRGLVYNEKGLCLDCTPTDEEISQLWHGVRSALAAKDVDLGDPRNFLTHNGLLSALLQARANLSHVTINGDSLISGAKAVSGKTAFFLTPPNARILIRRQASESSRAGRKNSVSRQPPGSGSRRFPLPSQPTKQATDPVRLFSSHYETGFPHEALDKFHLAEMHAGGLLEDKRVAVAMETQKPGDACQRSQQQGLTTISMEEQKILLSLDRLNHQLHCVQEHIGGNTGLELIDPPCTQEAKSKIHHRHRAFSADSRSGNQRKL
ncbi:hypothetical protein LDENG_00225310 [Lucifuga dentata]|nr:hypothetical protein LDENG_00225310 [Lucifuga dentata]